MEPRLKVLIVTNLFPNRGDPGYAPFNRQQFKALGEIADVDVWAVIPWRFGKSTMKGRTKDIPLEERIEDLPVRHPRYLAIPGLSALNAASLTTALLPELAKIRKRLPDVILAAYAYPDGCAGVLLGRILGRPVVIKCHGSDLNRVPEDFWARQQLQLFLPRADKIVVVSKMLGERAKALGARDEQIEVIYNGIDRDRFSPKDRGEARARLGLPGDRGVVLYVGHLAEHKGAGDLLQAAKILAERRPTSLVVFVGDGPARAELEAAARISPQTIKVVGPVKHDGVADYLAACDLLCLPSWDEGMPNVVREAHAAGRPVVATRVGGIPEAVHRPELGRLVEPKSPAALADALVAELDAPKIPPERILELGVVPTWKESAAQLEAVLQGAALIRRRNRTV